MNDEKTKKLFAELQKAVDDVRLQRKHRCIGNCGKSMDIKPLQFTLHDGKWSMTEYTADPESSRAGWVRISEMLRTAFEPDDPVALCPECRQARAI